VLGEHLYTLGNEIPDNEFVQARSVNDGKRLWQTRLGNVGTNISQANYAAARSTPTVDGEYLYALGSDCDLASIKRTDGKPRTIGKILGLPGRRKRTPLHPRCYDVRAK
jgi:hypothetical protein